MLNQPADRDKEPNRAPLPAYARLKEERERVAGGGSWSVDGSRRICHSCQQEIVRGTWFWTVLRPAEQEPVAADGVAAFFCRQDHCEACIDSLKDEQYFARWRTSVPAPEGPPRRIVNLASLFATFLSLIDPTEPPTASGEAVEEESEQQPEEPDESEPTDQAPRAGGLSVSLQADRVRLGYLLALFLVRKKALRWQAHDGDHLLVSERSGNLYRVPVPRIDPQELEAAVAEFEDLLG